LATAAMIVILYLSGVRPGEALELQVGCCPDPIDDGTGSIRYQLHGLFFKGARTPDSTPARGGIPREMPWTVIPPVAEAVRVLERIVVGPLLFPTNPPWITGTCGRRQRTGDAMTTLAANARIASFIAGVNDYVASNGLNDERIPDDPDGDIVVNRLRRTIAWHIGRRPGGRIALALQ
ncbi:integrase, partial [Rhodococcus opacus]|nr:integrase [Rhodococcus opacus]